MYKENIVSLNEKFKEIQKMGWIKGNTKGLGGIGNTFESLLGIDQNELEIPDYNGIEIKTKRAFSRSNTSLFNCVPDGPHYHEVERIKDTYGYPDSKQRQYKVLNTSVNCKDMQKVGLFYFFKLRVDRNKKKLFLEIYNHAGKLIEDFVYWDFDSIEQKLYRKMKYLAFIRGYIKRYKDCEYYKYYSIEFYKLKDFDTFIKLIEDGIIRISFKLSIYRWGPKEGKIHDHGTSFNLNEDDFTKLYDKIIV